MTMFSSASYWEARYCSGGTSGAGSHGHLARYKAHFINAFAKMNAVSDVLDLGCGDGRQLELLDIAAYTGVDVSPSALARCRSLFNGRPGVRFIRPDEIGSVPLHEMALSLDVIYHLVEDTVFHSYLGQLFANSTRYVIIYSSNFESTWPSPHVRHRRVTDAARHHEAWRLAAHIPNAFPFRPDAPDETSFADFFVFARAGQDCVVPSFCQDAFPPETRAE